MFKAEEKNLTINAVEGGRLIQSNGDYRRPRINGLVDIIGVKPFQSSIGLDDWLTDSGLC
jgi:hypothetical protein